MLNIYYSENGQFHFSKEVESTNISAVNHQAMLAEQKLMYEDNFTLYELERLLDCIKRRRSYISKYQILKKTSTEHPQFEILKVQIDNTNDEIRRILNL